MISSMKSFCRSVKQSLSLLWSNIKFITQDKIILYYSNISFLRISVCEKFTLCAEKLKICEYESTQKFKSVMGGGPILN